MAKSLYYRHIFIQSCLCCSRNYYLMTTLKNRLHLRGFLSSINPPSKTFLYPVYSILMRFNIIVAHTSFYKIQRPKRCEILRPVYYQPYFRLYLLTLALSWANWVFVLTRTDIARYIVLLVHIGIFTAWLLISWILCVE